MNVSYCNSAPSNPNDPCMICRDPLGSKEEEVVAHNLEGSPKLWHHVHKVCVNEWLKVRASCPQCDRPIAVSLRHRVVLRLKGALHTAAMVGKVIIIGSIAAVAANRITNIATSIAFAATSVLGDSHPLLRGAITIGIGYGISVIPCIYLFSVIHRYGINILF